MTKVQIEDIRFTEARQAIQENLSLLDPVKHKTVYNMTITLGYLLQQQWKLQDDVGLLHNKLQPILVEIAEDSNWRDRYPKYD
jgi:hypothetical protein